MQLKELLEEEDFFEVLEEDEFLTTVDNPYDPFEEFESWWLFDHEKGHNTLELIDRFSEFKPNESDYDGVSNFNKAIFIIISLDEEEKYRLVRPKSKKEEKSDL